MGFGAAPLLIALGVLLTAGIIVVLYWVRPEPQPVVVPSNLIWRRVLDERRRREDFWRWLVSLVIALLAGLAVILAVSQPLPEGAARGGRIVVVMDTAPSMAAALPGGGTRWEQAAEQVRRILTGSSETSEFLLLDTAGDRGGRSFIGRREALEALGDLGPVHGREHRFPDVAISSERVRKALRRPTSSSWETGSMYRTRRKASSASPSSNRRRTPGSPLSTSARLPSDPGRFEAFIEVVRHPDGEDDAGVVVLQIDGAGGASTRRTLRVDPETRSARRCR